MRSVPSFFPRRYAHSSLPSMLGVGTAGADVLRSILTMVMRELFRPRKAPRAAAAFPPHAKPRSARVSLQRVVRRAYTLVDGGESLGEYPTGTRSVFPQEAANHHQEPQGFSATGQVGKHASVVTVNTMGNVLAKRASSFGRIYRQG